MTLIGVYETSCENTASIYPKDIGSAPSEILLPTYQATTYHEKYIINILKLLQYL